MAVLSMDAALVSARAERYTAREQTETTCKLLGEVARERDTALGRIAELEAEVKIAWEEDPLVSELRKSIARAVAELEQCREPRTGAVERALEILKP